MASRPQGTLPGRTENNPKGNEQAKAVQLRSGRELKEDDPKTSLREEKETQKEAEFEAEKPKESENQQGTELQKTPYWSVMKQELPYPNRQKKKMLDQQFRKFLEVFKKLQINIPFADALEQMPSYVKFMKDILSKKRKFGEHETVALTEGCSALLQHKLPKKLKDPGSFTIPCEMGHTFSGLALVDLGASINLMPLSIFKKLGIGECRPTSITLQLADRSITRPIGVVEDVLVKVEKFIFPADFLIMDIEADREVPIILGRPFLATGRTIIDVEKGELIIRVENEEVKFNVFESCKSDAEENECFMIRNFSPYDPSRGEYYLEDGLKIALMDEELNWREDVQEIVENLDSLPRLEKDEKTTIREAKSLIPSTVQAPSVELKPLPSHLRYTFLGNSETLPVIISSDLSVGQEEQLLSVLRKHKRALGWTIADIRGISPSFCVHKILLEADFKPSVEAQRRLNPNMKEVVKKKVLKLLDAGIIYPISDSTWVSPVQCVPKKGGITVVPNENNELIPTRVVAGWRVCIDYRKLNKATRKDHFPLPFIDQMLDRLGVIPFIAF